MQRDYFLIDQNARGNKINERESPINNFRGEDEVNRRRAGIPGRKSFFFWRGGGGLYVFLDPPPLPGVS